MVKVRFSTQLDGFPGGEFYSISELGRPLAYSSVLDYWQHDIEFTNFFMQLLSESKFDAYRWETPAVSIDNLERNFEFVLLDYPALICVQDKTDFQAYLDSNSGAAAVKFENLGGDAILICPGELNAFTDYSHLAAFIRTAATQQKHDFWKFTGSTMQQIIGDKPVWLSTMGAAVPWLHMRLDSYPKYYSYEKYRNAIR